MESRHELKDDEDDVFYCKLRRQVLFLTEDEDDEEYKLENKHSNLAKGPYERPITTALLPGSYFTWLEVESADSVPAWLSSLWRTTSSGTGVFIPHAVVHRHLRRHRHRAGRNKTKKTHPVEGQNMYSSGS